MCIHIYNCERKVPNHLEGRSLRSMNFFPQNYSDEQIMHLYRTQNTKSSIAQSIAWRQLIQSQSTDDQNSNC